MEFVVKFRRTIRWLTSTVCSSESRNLYSPDKVEARCAYALIGSKSQAAFKEPASQPVYLCLRFVNQSVGRTRRVAIRSRQESTSLGSAEESSTLRRRFCSGSFYSLRRYYNNNIVNNNNERRALMSDKPQLAYAIIRHDSQNRLVLLVVACFMGRRSCRLHSTVIGIGRAFGSSDFGVN